MNFSYDVRKCWLLSAKSMETFLPSRVPYRAAIIDMIKHSSLGGGGRDRVAVLGLLHKRTVVLLDMQLPSAKTLEASNVLLAPFLPPTHQLIPLLGDVSYLAPLQVVDNLLKTLRVAKKVDGNHIDLEKAFDVAFTFLKDLQGDRQIFICTVNDDPCDKTKKQRGVSEEMVCTHILESHPRGLA